MKLLHFIVALLFLSACSTSELHSGDLLFAVAGGSQFDEAIDASTGGGEESFTHVGIAEVAADGVFVIEARPDKGVCRTPIEEFVEQNGEPRVMRLCQKYDMAVFVERAKSHLGEPYDESFLPDNGRLYCSELVYDSYVLPDGRHIFESRPMNFLSNEGVMPKYWIDHFDRLGIPIPQDVPGTNPNDLSRSNLLKRQNTNPL
ncbi:MAG: YiiX/YebB-like N1pC/P60 family cysteine hydrolase [Tidjanibacter sp.]|nr:YiiX/YebB-like N1pC/P60 family cysteine hydrolase [Tidjanibacter sp.]